MCTACEPRGDTRNLHDGGVRRSLIFWTQKNTQAWNLHPNKYESNRLIHVNPGTDRNKNVALRFETQKNTLIFFKTQKNTRRISWPKKILRFEILDPKKYVGPPRRVNFEYPPWACESSHGDQVKEKPDKKQSNQSL